MVEVGKTIWTERTARERAVEHNTQPPEEKVRRLLARCGFTATESGLCAVNMREYGAMSEDDELSVYAHYPVALARILLWRRAEGYWKTGEAQTLLAEYDRGDMGPEDWQRLYISVYEDKLYLDLPV